MELLAITAFTRRALSPGHSRRNTDSFGLYRGQARSLTDNASDNPTELSAGDTSRYSSHRTAWGQGWRCFLFTDSSAPSQVGARNWPLNSSLWI